MLPPPSRIAVVAQARISSLCRHGVIRNQFSSSRRSTHHSERTHDETASRVTSFHIRGPSEIENL